MHIRFSIVRFISTMKYIQELRQSQWRNVTIEISKAYNNREAGLASRRLLK